MPAGFYEYRCQVTFDDGSVRVVTDPCARDGGFSAGNVAVVVGGSTPAENVVRPPGGRRRPPDAVYAAAPYSAHPGRDTHNDRNAFDAPAGQLRLEQDGGRWLGAIVLGAS